MVRQRYILKEWDELATRIMTTNMPQQQRDDLKRMFFAGATAVVAQLNDHGTPNLRKLFDMSQELLEWGQTTRRIIAAQESASSRGPMPPLKVEVMRAIEHSARSAYNALDAALEGALNRRELGGALFLFSFTGPELTYISNAERQDMLKMLREFLESNPPQMTWDEQHG